MEDGGGGADHIAIEDHRNAFHARRQDRASDRRDLAAAKAAHHLKRIGEMFLVVRDGRFHGRDFSRQAKIIESGAPADPIGRRAAVKRMVDGGRDRRIADAHFAEAQKIDPAGDGFHPKSEGRGGLLFLQGRGLGDVLRRNIERQIENLQAKPIGRANLVDRGASGSEIVHHGARDRGRIGRHAFFHDAMIAGENRDERPVDRRHGLRPAKRQGTRRFPRAGRATQAVWSDSAWRARTACRDASEAPGMERNKSADRIKRQFCGGHRGLKGETRVSS